MKQKRVERKQEKHDHYTKQKPCRKNFLTNFSDSNIYYFATKTRKNHNHDSISEGNTYTNLTMKYGVHARAHAPARVIAYSHIY